MLKRAHCARIHVQVRIAFLKGDLEATTFEETTNRGGCYAFSQGGNNTAGNKNIFWRHPCSPGSCRACLTSTGVTYEQLSSEPVLLSNIAFLPQKKRIQAVRSLRLCDQPGALPECHPLPSSRVTVQLKPGVSPRECDSRCASVSVHQMRGGPHN